MSISKLCSLPCFNGKSRLGFCNSAAIGSIVHHFFKKAALTLRRGLHFSQDKKGDAKKASLFESQARFAKTTYAKVLEINKEIRAKHYSDVAFNFSTKSPKLQSAVWCHSQFEDRNWSFILELLVGLQAAWWNEWFRLSLKLCVSQYWNSLWHVRT